MAHIFHVLHLVSCNRYCILHLSMRVTDIMIESSRGGHVCQNKYVCHVV